MLLSDINKLTLLENTSYNLKYIIKYVYNNIDWSGQETLVWHSKFIDENPEYFNSDDDDDYDQIIRKNFSNRQYQRDFKKWFNFEIELLVSKIYKQINEYIKDGIINVYRSIIVKNIKIWAYNTEIGKQKLGVYWSFDEISASPHWGTIKGTELILHGRCEQHYIDWNITIAHNILHNGENEIHLFANSKVLLIDIKHKPNVQINDKTRQTLTYLVNRYLYT